jgi:hypothetical protein
VAASVTAAATSPALFSLTVPLLLVVVYWSSGPQPGAVPSPSWRWTRGTRAPIRVTIS